MANLTGCARRPIDDGDDGQQGLRGGGAMGFDGDGASVASQ